MATQADIYDAIRKADAAGDADSVRKLGAYLQTMQTPQLTHDQIAAKVDADPISQGARSVARDMSGPEQFVAAYGGAIPGLIQGARQLHGLLNPQAALYNRMTDLQGQVDESKRLNAPLNDTRAGFWGGLTGNVAATAPLAVATAPGVVGAAGIGALTGALQPTATGESRALNTAIGGVAGPLALWLGKATNALYQGGKAIIEPFTAAGPQRIAGRLLDRFAENPNALRGTMPSGPTITGARPTLAEQTGDRGLAGLQDSLGAADQQFANALEGRLAENNAARVSALNGLAGQDGARTFAEAERKGTAGAIYKDAFANNGSLTPSQLKAQASLLKPGKIEALLETPAIADARKAAQTIAANKGTPMDDPAGSIEGLHYMKLAMDDAISAARGKGTAVGDNLAHSIEAAQKRLVGAIETLSPDYKSARTVYAQMSKPINSMDIAQELVNKGVSNGSSLRPGGEMTKVINRNALLGAMKDEPALMQRATGRTLGNGLSDVMAPEDLNMLRTIASEADRAGAVASAGNGPGAATAKRLASSNILNQLTSPLGKAGQAIADSTLASTVVGKATNWMYSGIAEPKIQQALLKAVLDPKEAQAALTAAKLQNVNLPPGLLARLVQQARTQVSTSSASARVPGQP